MTCGLADDDEVIRECAPFNGPKAVPARPAPARSPEARRGPLRPVVSLLDSQHRRQEPRGAGAAHSVNIAVYDASPDRRLLLAATLYGLGCEIVPLDCGSDAPEFLRAQLDAVRPDVVIWQLESASPESCASLLAVLGSGALAHIAVVLTTSTPGQVIEMLGDNAAMVKMLATPFSLVDLIGAVNAAQQERPVATHR
jgi:CheY-like chemotaxis protein